MIEKFVRQDDGRPGYIHLKACKVFMITEREHISTFIRVGLLLRKQIKYDRHVRPALRIVMTMYMMTDHKNGDLCMYAFVYWCRRIISGCQPTLLTTYMLWHDSSHHTCQYSVVWSSFCVRSTWSIPWLLCWNVSAFCLFVCLFFSASQSNMLSLLCNTPFSMISKHQIVPAK